MISISEGLTITVLFAALMLTLVVVKTHVQHGAEGFLVANRSLKHWQAAFSIAISWVWAPAIFVCSIQAYEYGLPGIFWFTVPNVVCFFIFAPLAIKLRDALPEGYTLPEYVGTRFPIDK